MLSNFVSLASAVKEEDNEEELNVEEESSAGGNYDFVQPTNDVTGDDGNVIPVLVATTTAVPTSEVLGGKKRSRKAASSTHNVTVQARSTKRAKLPYSTSTLHETAEEAGTTAQPRVVRMSARRASTKAHKGIFQGTSRGIEAEEEADDDFMPVVEEDGPPVDHGGTDNDDENDNKIIVAESDQQFCSRYKSFDERFKDLMGFKEKFGHCNVPQKKTGEYKSLGHWCSHLRMSYKKIQKSETPLIKLPQENIRQLEDAGFKWSLSTYTTFDERYAELMKYREKFGHCNVPKSKYGEYQSLGKWCSNLRAAYTKIQKNETPLIKLPQEMIQLLEDAGFKWSMSRYRTFAERYAELMKYKKKFDHCNVPKTNSGEYQSLGQWCRNLRMAYKKMQKGETSHHKLTPENIGQLEDAGFKWSLVVSA